MAHTQTGFRKWLPLVILSLALFIIVLDTTILNVSLRTIIIDLHTTIQKIQWVITAYSLMLAAFTITGGRLGDLFGRKRMFVVGAITFAIGSFITSISPNVGVMILGEAIIEGIGAALMMPATASLLVSNYEGRDRQIGFGIWGGIAAAGAALGPVFGGFLTTYYSWRWAFRINVVVAAILVLLAFVIKEARDDREAPKIDFLGILLSSVGLLAIVFGFIEASTYGWWSAKAVFAVGSVTLSLGGWSIVPVSIFVGLLFIIAFIFWEIHREKIGATPLVSTKLFKNNQFVLSTVITGILSLGQAGILFAIPVFYQGVLGLSALQTGIAMLPMSLTLLVVAPVSAYLAKYVTPKHIVQAGLALSALSFLVLRSGINMNSTAWSLAPGFALFGLGMGMMMSQLSNLALSAVSVEQSGEASGVNSTMRQLGATLGSAILGAILLSTLSANLVTGISTSAAIPAAMKPAITEAAQSQTSNIEFGTGITTAANVPSAVSNAVVAIGHQATVDANRATLLYGAGFILLGLLFSFRLPNRKNVEVGRSVAVSH